MGAAIVVQCGTCGACLERKPYQVRARKRHFCDRACWARAPERKTAPRDADTYYCPKCKQDRLREQFVWNLVNGTPRRRGYCVDCAKAARRHYHTEHRDHAKSLHASWRKLAQTEGGDRALAWLFTRRLSSINGRTRKRGLPPSDLDGSYLVGLYHKQGGLCFYTGQPLIVAPRSSLTETISLDRLIPSDGYRKGNVVLCSFATNTAKGSLTEEEFYSFCETVLKVRDTRK